MSAYIIKKMLDEKYIELNILTVKRDAWKNSESIIREEKLTEFKMKIFSLKKEINKLWKRLRKYR